MNEVDELQKKYGAGNLRQKKTGLALKVVGYELPIGAEPVNDNMDPE